MDKIVVIDGVDGSGKTTQVNMLKKKFPHFNYEKFPRYSSDTGYLIKAYLDGCYENNKDFAKLSELERIKKYSLLYTLDRTYYFHTEFHKFDAIKLSNSINVFDRYTTSNAFTQSAFLNDEDLNEYLEWLDDIEHNKFNIPRPDLIIFLDLPPEVSYQNLLNREELDIIETLDRAKAINEKKNLVIKKCNVHRINCYDSINNKMRNPEDIHEEIVEKIKGLM